MVNRELDYAWIQGLDDFAAAVLYARARLALVSPHDERDALEPLDEEAAWAIIAELEQRER